MQFHKWKIVRDFTLVSCSISWVLMCFLGQYDHAWTMLAQDAVKPVVLCYVCCLWFCDDIYFVHRLYKR